MRIVAQNTTSLGAARGITDIPHPESVLGVKFKFDPLPYYAVMFEQRVGGGMIKRAAIVSQSPSMIRQWLETVSAADGAPPTWEALPHPTRARVRTDGFVPPLDDVDGAARVYDPVVRGVRDGERLVGLFLKDYRPVSW